jgi:SAM-dependent methyltransferase
MDEEPRVGSRYLDGRYLEANPTWHEEDAPEKAGWILDMLAAHGDIRVKSICDVGCGTGGVLDALQHRFGDDVRVVGFEPSVVAVRLALEKRPGVEIIERGPTPDDGPFDVAVVLDVFEHIEDFYGFLRGLHGLADNFVFHIPLDMTAFNVLRVRELMSIRETLGHIHHFCPQTARASLESTGYEIVDERFTLVAGTLDRNQSLSVKLLRIVRRIGFKRAPDLTSRMIGGVSLLVLARSADDRVA